LAYHLKNADFIRDVMCFAPKSAREMIEVAHMEAQVKEDPELLVKAIMEWCSCTKTEEGFEACLNLHREDFLGRQGRYDEDPKFEKVLQELDAAFGGLKTTWAVEHKL
jgi:hypothetical protein